MIVSILLVGVAALIAAYALTLWTDSDGRTDASPETKESGTALSPPERPDRWL
jgi:hypothetical protein